MTFALRSLLRGSLPIARYLICVVQCPTSSMPVPVAPRAKVRARVSLTRAESVGMVEASRSGRTRPGVVTASHLSDWSRTSRATRGAACGYDGPLGDDRLSLMGPRGPRTGYPLIRNGTGKPSRTVPRPAGVGTGTRPKSLRYVSIIPSRRNAPQRRPAHDSDAVRSRAVGRGRQNDSDRTTRRKTAGRPATREPRGTDLDGAILTELTWGTDIAGADVLGTDGPSGKGVVTWSPPPPGRPHEGVLTAHEPTNWILTRVDRSAGEGTMAGPGEAGRPLVSRSYREPHCTR